MRAGHVLAAAGALLLAAAVWPGAAAAAIATTPGVSLDRLGPELRAALPLINRVSLDTIGRGVVVTSTFEGRHKSGSLHYVDRAIDIRTRDLTESQAQRYAAALRAALNARAYLFDVIVEYDPPHIHVESDPR